MKKKVKEKGREPREGGEGRGEGGIHKGGKGTRRESVGRRLGVNEDAKYYWKRRLEPNWGIGSSLNLYFSMPSLIPLRQQSVCVCLSLQVFAAAWA